MTEFLSTPFFVRGLLVLVCAGRSFSGDCSGARLVTTLGERYAYGVTLQAGDFSLPLNHLRARYLRAKFQVTNAPACDWLVSVRDQALRPVQTFHPKDLGPPGIAWTARVRGEHLRLDVTACADGRMPAVTALAYIEMPDKAVNTYYSVQDDKRFIYGPLYEPAGPTIAPEGVRPLGDNVGMLMASYGTQSWVCSGVLLTETLFLTNWHCGGLPPLAEKDFWRADIVQDTIIDLSWDGYGESREYAALTKVAGSPPLDYAILRVRAMHGKGDPAPVAIRQSGPKANRPVSIVQHPEGKTKQVSRCPVDEVDATRAGSPAQSLLIYRCGTEKGSSGAPIFDEYGLLVGLHHDGFAVDKDCGRLDTVNKGVQINRILEDLAESPIRQELRIVP
jgi:Trypsin-like peptidase domain